VIALLADGELSWVASIDRGAADLLAHRGLQASIILAVLLAAIAAGSSCLHLAPAPQSCLPSPRALLAG